MSTESTPLLAASQRRIVGFALALLALVGSFALVIGTFVVIGRLVAFFSNVLWPLAVAGVFALMLRPLVERIEGRLHIRRVVAVVLLYGLFVLAVAGASGAMVPALIDQFLAFIAYLPALWATVSNYLSQHYPEWAALLQRQLANPAVHQIANSIMNESQSLLAQAIPTFQGAFGGLLDIFAFFTHLAVVPVYLFFFLLARGEPTRELGHHLPFLKPGVRDDVVFLASEFAAIVEAFFRGQILIGCAMGVLFSIGFSLIGLKFGLFIGLAMGLLNIVPYLGTILGLAVTLPLAFFQPGGGWKLVALVLVVKFVVQSIEGWVLTPRIMGQKTGLHPVAIIFAVFFWGTAFGGILGMLLAIPLTAFFVTAWRLAKRKYFDGGEV
ncbi:MAG: AI-2E family transporter [Opitutus sp.]|nr:AI-2E family transporter [Opitutus sp.]